MSRGLVAGGVSQHGLGAAADLFGHLGRAGVGGHGQGGLLAEDSHRQAAFADQLVLVAADLDEAGRDPFASVQRVVALVADQSRAQLLDELGVQAYFCGHTHHYSTYQWLGNDDPSRWQEYHSQIIPGPIGVWQIDAGNARGRESSGDRTIVYCKVTGDHIKITTFFCERIGKGKFRPWTVPENTSTHGRRQLFRWSLSPDPQGNLPEL